MTVVDYEIGGVGAGSAYLLANRRGSAGLQAKSLWLLRPRPYGMAFATAVGEALTLHAGECLGGLVGKQVGIGCGSSSSAA